MLSFQNGVSPCSESKKPVVWPLQCVCKPQLCPLCLLDPPSLYTGHGHVISRVQGSSDTLRKDSAWPPAGHLATWIVKNVKVGSTASPAARMQQLPLKSSRALTRFILQNVGCSFSAHFPSRPVGCNQNLAPTQGGGRGQSKTCQQ